MYNTSSTRVLYFSTQKTCILHYVYVLSITIPHTQSYQQVIHNSLC